MMNCKKTEKKQMQAMGAIMAATTLLLVLLLSIGRGTQRQISLEKEDCKVWLVQSIPTDMPELPLVPGVLNTGDVLQWLAGNATEKGLDVSAQYWELQAEPINPISGDYGFSEQEMAHFGAPVGKAVYDSLLAAADRGLPIRILQHTGFSPSFDAESAAMAAGRPNVQNRTLVLTKWWGSGIIHSKLWIANKEDAYLGSANNDWKSFTQVKEVGVYFRNCPKVVKLLDGYFNNFWTLTSLNASEHTSVVWDQQWQLNRTVPCWSQFVEPHKRCQSPFSKYTTTSHVQGYPLLSDPPFFPLKLDTPGRRNASEGNSLAYVSVSPPEIASGHSHQTDEQGWLDTIFSVPVNGTVRINTMDWLGQSQFLDMDVFWPAFSNAISKVVFTKHATVKVLVARWKTTLEGTDKYLLYLNYTNFLCKSSTYNSCNGRVEIKHYEVPGWDSTGPASDATTGASTGNEYPGFARVNHAKFAVSDVRANIGTSNLVWDYFYATAGVSFGTYDPRIVSQLQEIFDADWTSPYAVPLLQTSSL